MPAKKKRPLPATRPRKRAPGKGRVAPAKDESGQQASPIRCPIIAIGASAGGLEAFKRFFTAMPPESGTAFVVIPHLDPTHGSLMVELLSRRTVMKVSEVEDGITVEPNCVYVIPPNKYLSIAGGRLRLTEPTEKRGFGTAIDPFFRSLAEQLQDSSIGIILSGTGSHGTPGLKEIKAVGGMAMAQDPETAEYDQMPRNAIDAGIVDYVLPPEKMPEALMHFISHTRPQPSKGISAADDAPDQIGPILDLLGAHTKYDFRCYRKSMLLRRVQRRMGLRHLDKVSAYIALLRKHPDEVTALYRDLLIGVTSFFREPQVFEVLKRQVIPDLVERRTGDVPVRVWVPACATGEEAYSIAILLLEHYRATKKTVNLQICASDIDENSLQAARQGIYTASSVSELSPDRLRKYFVKIDKSRYQVNKQLRGSIVVTRQNVISDPPFSKVDLICCRNLLIYLEPELQHNLMPLFHFALNERGYLVLGGGCLGAAIGQTFHRYWPHIVHDPQAYAIVGMAGFFAGCAHAPISTIIMVSEMTGDYKLLLPTMWVSTICFLLCRRWSLYSKQLPTRLDSPAHAGDFLVDLLEGIRVDGIYRPKDGLVMVPEAMPLEKIVKLISDTEQIYFPVTNEQGKMVGIFSANDLRAYLYNQNIWGLAIARDIMASDVLTVTPQDDLNTALRQFTVRNLDQLPVVDPQDSGILLGILRRKDTIAVYNRRLAERKQLAAD